MKFFKPFCVLFLMMVISLAEEPVQEPVPQSAEKFFPLYTRVNVGYEGYVMKHDTGYGDSDPGLLIAPVLEASLDFGKANPGSVFFTSGLDIFGDTIVEKFINGGVGLIQDRGYGKLREEISVDYVDQTNSNDTDEPLNYLSYNFGVEYKHNYKFPPKVKYSLSIINDNDHDRMDIKAKVTPSILINAMSGILPGTGFSYTWNNSSQSDFNYAGPSLIVYGVVLLESGDVINLFFDYSMRYFNFDSTSTRKSSGEKPQRMLTSFDCSYIKAFSEKLSANFDCSLMLNFPTFETDKYIFYRMSMGVAYQF